MPKTPPQAPIKLLRQGDGMFGTVADAMVPKPPIDCESQQLMDWGSTVSVMGHPKIDMAMKLRVVEAYAERWDIPTENTTPDEFPA